MSRTIIRIDMPNGLTYFHSDENHQAAHVSVDPFLWVLPGEPEGSLLYTDKDNDKEECPPTLRDPSLPGRYMPDVRR
jgi:hypothetical protein